MINHSLIIPVYKNTETIGFLVDALNHLSQSMDNDLEVVFVVDGSPDDSSVKLNTMLPEAKFSSQLIEHSKNFGSMSAIRTGLERAKGKYHAVISADLQEPIQLVLTFFKELSTNEIDVVIGTRVSRQDPFLTKLSSNIFWSLYRIFVMRSIPSGGIDCFGCNDKVTSVLLQLNESNSSLMAQVIWVGFRRRDIPYNRLMRVAGRSSWTFRKRFNYMLDSVFTFTDKPIKLMLTTGLVGITGSIVISFIVFAAWFQGLITQPGYTPIVLLILFAVFSNLTCLGIIGNYVWRAFENSKQRPLGIVMKATTFNYSEDY